jgi:hypothetical protein
MESYSKELCNDGIMLDPRLRNYIQYRKAYERDGIDTGVPLEKMFQISKEDLKTIRKFTHGKRDLYTMKKLGSSETNFVKRIKQKFENVNDKFKNDPHYKKIQEKMKKTRDADAQRNNYKTIENNYDMYSDNELTNRNILNIKYKNQIRTPYDTNENKKRDLIYKNRNKNKFLLDSNDDDLKYDNPNHIFHPKRRSNMVYHNEPKISLNERLRTNIKNNNVSKINESIKMTDKYRKKIGTHSYSHTRDLDSYGDNLRSIDADTDMRFGVNSRGGKSLGYKNPFEHQFQYIDDDLQHPDHVVNDRGISTRLYNKSRRKYKRDIYR